MRKNNIKNCLAKLISLSILSVVLIVNLSGCVSNGTTNNDSTKKTLNGGEAETMENTSIQNNLPIGKESNSKNNANSENSTTNNKLPDEETNINLNLNKSDFAFLKKGVTLKEIIQVVGAPHRSVGSGVMIPVYDLLDRSFIVLNFNQSTKALQMATLVHPDGKKEPLIDD